MKKLALVLILVSGFISCENDDVICGQRLLELRKEYNEAVRLVTLTGDNEKIKDIHKQYSLRFDELANKCN